MANAKTLAKKAERARLAGRPASVAVAGAFGERCHAINALLAKRYGSPSRVEAPEPLADGRDGVSFVRVVLRGAQRVGRFKTSVHRRYIETTPDDLVAEHIARAQEAALDDYLRKELGNSRLKVAIEDERAYREKS